MYDYFNVTVKESELDRTPSSMHSAVATITSFKDWRNGNDETHTHPQSVTECVVVRGVTMAAAAAVAAMTMAHNCVEWEAMRVIDFQRAELSVAAVIENKTDYHIFSYTRSMYCMCYASTRFTAFRILCYCH